MREFQIFLHSIREVQDFVSLSTVQPFGVYITTPHQKVSAKSFIGMFAVDFRCPVTVSLECGEPDFQSFRQAATRFLV